MLNEISELLLFLSSKHERLELTISILIASNELALLRETNKSNKTTD